jgi:hypothetical protein
MPQLVDLEIWNPSLWWANDFVNHVNGKDIPFLSHLQHLALLGCSKLTAPSDILYPLQNCLTDRWQARHRPGFAELMSFRLVWTEDLVNVPDEALLPFQTLEAEGMDVHIKCRTTSYI